MQNFTVKASSILIHDYCEYKFYLQYVEKIEVPPTEFMIAGSRIHQDKETKFLDVAEPSSWEEFFASKEYSVTKEIFLKSMVENILLMGRIDEIGVDNDYIYIIEDKPNARPFNSYKKQLYAYCYLFKKNFSDINHKPIFGIIRDRDSEFVVFKEPYTLKQESLLISTLSRIKKVMAKDIEPIPTNNKNKCSSCAMGKFNFCKYSNEKINNSA